MLEPKSQHPNVLIVSLGCAKNLVDTEVMCGTLASAGFMLTNIAEAADLMLINTCSFIKDARTESAEAIDQGLAWRRRKKGRRLAVAGCWPQRDEADLKRRFPDIDILIGLDEIPMIAEILEKSIKGTLPVKPRIGIEPRYLYDHDTPRLQLTPGNYAYVKITEGCNHGCRFCAIPAIRGRLRSRTIESILQECQNLLGNGVRELNLIGQDTTAFGRDRGATDGLLRLTDQLEQLTDDFWLRLLYTHPLHLSDELIYRMGSGGRLLPYLDLPLQHIDDRILRSMGRGMGEQETLNLLQKIRDRDPGIAVRTSFMVGYPGETDRAFEKLLQLLRDYRFNHVGVFTFSPEPGTAAAKISENLVEPSVQEERRAILMKEQQVISHELNQGRVGQILPVLVEGAEAGRIWRGRTTSDAPEVDGTVRFTGGKTCMKAGIVNVRITKSDCYDLTGKAVAGTIKRH